MLQLAERWEDGAVADAGEDSQAALIQKVQMSIERLEAEIHAFRSRSHQGQHEVVRLQKENTALKSEREDMARAVKILKNRNDQLHAQLENVSARLDAAIDKIGEILQD